MLTSFCSCCQSVSTVLSRMYLTLSESPMIPMALCDPGSKRSGMNVGCVS